MPEDNKALKELQDMQNYVQGRLVDKKSFTSFVQAIARAWKKLHGEVVDTMGKTKRDIEKQLKDTLMSIERSMEEVRSELVAGFVTTEERITNAQSFLQAQISANMELLSEEIAKPVDFSEIYEDIERLESQIPEEFDATEIMEDIEEIKDKLEELDKREYKITNTHNATIVGRDIVKDIDLSAQLDGVTKTFNIQAVYNIVSVSLSSYPYGSLRKGVDYTWTPTSITFTSTIDAETQLASGQQCILTVVQG